MGELVELEIVRRSRRVEPSAEDLAGAMARWVQLGMELTPRELLEVVGWVEEERARAGG